MKATNTIVVSAPVNAPSDSWWICDDQEFSTRLHQREEAMRLSKLGQQESPSYAPSVYVYRPRKRQEI